MNIPDEICDPGKRYDFLLLFDVQDGNPNGDPDAGNLPRLDPETMQGIVTDVCLKRKIRNYVELLKGSEFDELDTDGEYGIFVRDSGVALNTKIKGALVAVGEVNPNAKPPAEEEVIAGDSSAEPTGGKESKGAKKPKKPTRASGVGKNEMCKRYFDVRVFGGVLSTGKFPDMTDKTYVTCGQVRGPMQLTFSRSIDPIIPADISITRVAITKETDQKEGEFGRKALVPYGLYMAKGFYSPMLAAKRRDGGRGGTGVSEADMRLFWQALVNMFEMDRSASRGFMEVRGVYVFRHENPLGNERSGKLFDSVAVKRKSSVETARSFGDYDVQVSRGMPEGVTLIPLAEG